MGGKRQVSHVELQIIYVAIPPSWRRSLTPTSSFEGGLDLVTYFQRMEDGKMITEYWMFPPVLKPYGCHIPPVRDEKGTCLCDILSKDP